MSDKRRRRRENSEGSDHSESEEKETKDSVSEVDLDKDEGVVSRAPSGRSFRPSQLGQCSPDIRLSLSNDF